MRPVFLVCLVFTSCWIQSGPTFAAPPQTLQDRDKQLVIDRRVIERAEGVELVQGRVEKHAGNPLFQADRPWESSLNNLYPNVVFDADEGLFKLWYKCVLADTDAIAKLDPPRTVHDVGWLLLYATSRDGLTWDKPALGLHSFGGSKDNNAVARDTPNVGVFRDTNPQCPADRRLKMIYDTGLGQIKVRFSADGLRWTEPIAAEGLGARVGDTHNNAFWDERLKRYVLISRLVIGERLVARSESDDFIHWQPATLALRSTLEEGRDRQTYCMPSFAYGSGYIGLVMMYNVGTDRSVDCELAWSEDSVSWRRLFPGQPFVPRGEGDAYDSKCIYAAANPPIVRDGKLWLFYGGDDFEHTGWKRHCLPCLATLRLDGFAGYRNVDSRAEVVKESVGRNKRSAVPASEASDTRNCRNCAPLVPAYTFRAAKDRETGSNSGRAFAERKPTIVTHPLRATLKELTVSADAAGGRLLVEVLDAQSCEVLATSESFSVDATDGAVRWSGDFDFTSLGERPVRLRFTLEDATLYTFRGARPIEQTHDAVPTARRLPTPIPVTNAQTVAATFDSGAEGWTGLDKLKHIAEGGASVGFVRATREKYQPYLLAEAAASGGAIVGNWPEQFGGDGVRIAFKQRATAPHVCSSIEIFARDISQWSFDGLPAATSDWTEVSTTIRFDWTDAEAKAAGWRPAINAFSWQETIHNVGRLVIFPRVRDEALSFDIDDVSLTAASESRYAFVVSGDPQYLAEHAPQPTKLDPYSEQANARWIELLNELPGREIPESLGGGRVSRDLLGLLVTGDLIDSADKNGGPYPAMQRFEWQRFVADYGLNGRGGKIAIPVYELHGNHDGPQGDTFVIDDIIRRNRLREGLAAISDNGLHYSWDWGPLHLVNLGIFVGAGDKRRADFHYSPRSSLEFLRDDLHTHVGDSGRPVVLSFHLHPNCPAFDWPPEDLAALWTTIEQYQVIALFHGHTHGSPPSRLQWDGKQFAAKLPGGIDVFNPDDSAAAKTDPRDPAKMAGGAHGFLYVELIDRPGIKNDEFIVRSYATRDNWATHGWHTQWRKGIRAPDVR